MGRFVQHASSEPWSRSRFWLCHFLHNRHVRAKIDWQPSPPSNGRLPATALAGFRHRLLQPQQGLKELIEQAAATCGHDPAFVQVLRLHFRERQWHEQQLCQLIHRHAPGHALEAVVSRRKRVTANLLGMRYFLASLLLDDVLDIVLLRHAMAGVSDEATRAMLAQLRQDKLAHAAFLGEYLTLAYADFNFIRRNLRRARLRGLYTIHLRRVILREAPLMHAIGLGRRELTRQCWQAFDRVMATVVPYHRDALLQALTRQQDQPFDEAPLPSLG